MSTPQGTRSAVLRRCRGAADDGLTLIELMMAMMIFTIAATGIMGGFVSTLKKSTSDKNRIAAANLGTRELEIVRNVFNSKVSGQGPAAIVASLDVTNPNPLPGQTAGQPLVVDGGQYTVRRQVQWMPAGAGDTNACEGSGGVAYPSLAVKVTVTWPNMGGVAPVVNNTILTPPKKTVADNIGFVAVKVTDSSLDAVPGVPVSVTSGATTYTGTTDDAGCATLGIKTAGTYSATLAAPDANAWVDYYGATVPTKTASVSLGAVTKVTFNYDQAASLNLSLTTAAGYSLPGISATQKLLKSTVANTGLQPSGVGTVNTPVNTGTSSTGPLTISNLWPFTDGYTIWAGSCTQSDPAAAGGTRGTPIIIGPGASKTATIALAPVTVTVTKTTLVAVPSVTVLATPVTTTGCDASENPLSLGVTDANGMLKTSLPAGQWTLTVSGKTISGGPYKTATLLPTSAATAVAVKVT